MDEFVLIKTFKSIPIILFFFELQRVWLPIILKNSNFYQQDPICNKELTLKLKIKTFFTCSKRRLQTKKFKKKNKTLLNQ